MLSRKSRTERLDFVEFVRHAGFFAGVIVAPIKINNGFFVIDREQ